jgi:hypothetical protein
MSYLVRHSASLLVPVPRSRRRSRGCRRSLVFRFAGGTRGRTDAHTLLPSSPDTPSPQAEGTTSDEQDCPAEVPAQIRARPAPDLN